MKLHPIFIVTGLICLGIMSPKAAEPLNDQKFTLGSDQEELIEMRNFSSTSDEDEGESVQGDSNSQNNSEWGSTNGGVAIMGLGIIPGIYAIVTKSTVWGLAFLASEVCKAGHGTDCSIPNDYPCGGEYLTMAPAYCGINAVGTYSFYTMLGCVGVGTCVVIGPKLVSYIRNRMRNQEASLIN